MSDEELLKSLDTFACQLREVNAKLIYAAKDRIERLTAEVAALKTEIEGCEAASRERQAWNEKDRLRAEAAEAEAARLREVLTIARRYVEASIHLTADLEKIDAALRGEEG